MSPLEEAAVITLCFEDGQTEAQGKRVATSCLIALLIEQGLGSSNWRSTQGTMFCHFMSLHISQKPASYLVTLVILHPQDGLNR